MNSNSLNYINFQVTIVQVGKRYKILLRNEYTYTGEITQIKHGFIHMIDINGITISFAKNFVRLSIEIPGGKK